MKLLRSLLETDDLSKLPQDTISELEKLIREGAKDKEQKWANALELVHKAYEVAQIQRPTPDMKDAWQQYEDLLKFAVKELTKHRGIDGDWRMSAHIFHEAAPAVEPTKYEITSTLDDLPVVGTVTADNIDEVIRPFYKFNITGHELEVKHRSPNHCCVYFCKDGKRTGAKVTIKKVPTA